VQDLRLAVRALLATPVVSFVAALSLALGIGANIALYSLANSLLFRPLPVKEPERLVRISDTATAGNQYHSLPVWEDIRQRSGLFDAAAAWSAARFTHTDGIESIASAPSPSPSSIRHSLRGFSAARVRLITS
jgi:hypothetical protein